MVRSLANHLSQEFERGFSFVNAPGVLAALKVARETTKAQQTEAHALRVAWRILKDWVEVQLALVEAKQAEMQTVFLPYALIGEGKTVGDVLRNGDLKRISS